MNRSRKLPIFSIILGVLLLFVAALLIWKASLNSANRQRINAITARDEPADAAALDKFYKSVPDAENAALLWLRGAAAASPDLMSVAGQTTLKRGVRLSEQQLKLATEALAANEDALALFHRAATLSHSRYPIALNQLPFTNMDHFGEIKGAAQVLRTEAAVSLEQGDPSRTTGAIEGMFAAADSLALEPLVISQLVRYAIDAIAIHTLQFALNATALNESDLTRIQTALLKADDLESVSRGLLGERAFFVLRDPGRFAATTPGFAPNGLEEAFLLPLTGLIGFWQRDLRFGVDALTTNILWARLPDPQRLHSMTNSDSLAAQAKAGHYILTGIYLPSLVKFVLRDANHRAQARTALVAVAVERFRLANDGKLPGQLSDLVPSYLDKIPVDPFDGRPVRYKRTSNGYVVYSVGPDETDDGGIEPPPGPKPKALWDVTFVVERPLNK